MNRTRTLRLGPALAAALAVTAALARPAHADDPPDYSLAFTLYDTPGDNESDVKAVVTVDLRAVSRSGTQVQWGVLAIRVVIPANGLDPERVWADTTPRLDAGDLWWAADPDTPSGNILVDLPALEGTAAAVSGTATDLLFAFKAEEPANAELYGGNCADATYSLALQTAPEEPIVDADDEPTEITPNAGG